MKKTLLLTLFLSLGLSNNLIKAGNTDDLPISLSPIQNTIPIKRLEVKNFNTLCGNNLYEYEYNFAQYAYYYGEQIIVKIGFVNNQAETFEGQYGIAVSYKHEFYDNAINEAYPKYLIYESPEIMITPNEEILDTIRTKGLEILKPYSLEDSYGGRYQFTPLIKKKGENDWKILDYDKKPTFDMYNSEVWTYGGFFLQGNFTCSAETVDKLEPFVVDVPLFSDESGDIQEVKIGLYKTTLREGMRFTYDASPVEMKTIKREGSKYYCEVEAHAEPGSYLIIPVWKDCPDEILELSTASYRGYESYYMPGASEGNKYEKYAHLNVTNVIKGSSLNGNLSENINIYPNPVKDVLQVRGNTADIIGYKLVNVVGKTIKSERNVTDLTSLDLSDLATGTYILILEYKNSDKPVHLKVIKK